MADLVIAIFGVLIFLLPLVFRFACDCSVLDVIKGVRSVEVEAPFDKLCACCDDVGAFGVNNIDEGRGRKLFRDAGPPATSADVTEELCDSV